MPLLKYRDDAMLEPDPVKRDVLLKEAGVYGTSQFFYAAGPVMTGYQFWQPWLKGYQGETWLRSGNIYKSISAIICCGRIKEDKCHILW